MKDKAFAIALRNFDTLLVYRIKFLKRIYRMSLKRSEKLQEQLHEKMNNECKNENADIKEVYKYWSLLTGYFEDESE